MSFQAPFDVMEYARMQQSADQQKAAQQQAMMEGIQQGIGDLMNTYVNIQTTNAKGKAIGNFLKMHGEQLGFEPTYLESLLKKKPYEIAMESDALGLSNMGRQVMNNQYLQNQMGGGGYGSGGGGGQPFMRVP